MAYTHLSRQNLTCADIISKENISLLFVSRLTVIDIFNNILESNDPKDIVALLTIQY